MPWSASSVEIQIAPRHVGTLGVMERLAHAQRRERLPCVRDVVAQQSVAVELVHRVRGHRRRVDGDERVLVLGQHDRVDEPQRLAGRSRGRLVALRVVGLLERRVDVAADHVDVADVHEATGLPRGRDRRRVHLQHAQPVVGAPQAVGAREHPPAGNAGHALRPQRREALLTRERRVRAERRRRARGGAVVSGTVASLPVDEHPANALVIASVTQRQLPESRRGAVGHVPTLRDAA